MPSQNVVDEDLVPHPTLACFLAELIEHSGVDRNRNELAKVRRQVEGGPRPHGLQLRRRWIGNVSELNLAPCTLHARGGSPAVR